MNDLFSSPDFLNQYFPKDDSGADMVGLAFYFSFYFPDGMRSTYRNRVIQASSEYWNLCRKHLTWMTMPVKSNWKKIPDDYHIENWQQDLAKAVFTKFRPKAWPPETNREKLIAAIEGTFPETLTESVWVDNFPAIDWVWQMTFHSGANQRAAAQYKISGLGNSTQTNGLSYLSFCVPVTWFMENPQYHPISLYLRWAEILQAKFGSAGLGLVPATHSPYMSQTAGGASAFAKQFPGIDVADPAGQLDASGGLLACNWLNLIDDDLVKQLGGMDKIKAHLAKDRGGEVVAIHPFPGGVILSAGEMPQLVENNSLGQPPASYGAIARLLKPLRTSTPGGGWICGADESLSWLARFDKA